MRSPMKKGALAALLSALSLLLLSPVASAVSLPSPGEGTEALSPLIDTLSLFLAADNLGASVTPLILAVTLVGILLALFGYPLLRMTIFLGGFGTGIALGTLLLASERFASLLTSPWMPAVVMLLLGALFAWLFCKLFSLALFFTVLGAVVLVGLPIAKVHAPNLLVAILIVVLAGIVLGLLATRFVRPIIVLVTAVTGAFLVSLALAGVIPVPHIKLVLFALVLLLGLAVQLRTRGHVPRID